jgi:hypothetical protein
LVCRENVFVIVWSMRDAENEKILNEITETI